MRTSSVCGISAAKRFAYVRRIGAVLDVAFEAGELSTVIAMVDTGLGVSIVPPLGLPTSLDEGDLFAGRRAPI
ncbi:hypothetical protein SBI_00152 [Streptomyces bingchenggensis BCW-1]|uniref:LysR family transcriptional regulator n=2 Tax=Streptomyces TaxID=1883 RepID=D7BUT2_STRBB|nr:hypothetical protein SBI_00152 [Streptomyces bingchenggensis BCW-1]